jgi:NAD+ kinase
VRSKIQHVLIVTKARDNRLIQLTRELAIYLMQKKPVASPGGGRNSDRGMVVYVDAQLRSSKRFDATGIQKENPELFQPIHKRRSSSSASISAFSSTTSMGDFARRSKDEGQLRYWTGEMCSNSPHLFDFVITVSDLSRLY